MSGGKFDPEAIRALAAILTEAGLTEIEVSDNETRIRVVRAHAPAAAQTYAAPAAAAAPPQAAAAVDDASHPGAVTSPMVGVAFLAPEPTAANFVQVGQAVQAGQTLLLIEAMKTFNQIKAPRAGTVARILVSSGVPVEFGEALMVLE
jgi:acetyl-CoA carboxylase biotin carboxyl carrier protein